MNNKNRLFLNISRSDCTETKSYTLSVFWGKFLIYSPLLMILLSLIFLGFARSEQLKNRRYLALKEENALLREKLSEILSDLDSINVKLKLMEKWEDEIREKQNLKVFGKDLREQGIGGIPQTDHIFSYDDNLSQEYNELVKYTKIIKAKTNFNSKTHKELLSIVTNKGKFWQHMPSIFPAYGRITDTFGWRRDPFTGRRGFHAGIDIANDIGTPVYATADGIISETNRKSDYGNFILINHGNSLRTRYAHLYKILVKEGERVEKGQIIGLMGSTGRSTGSHLHYEVIKGKQELSPYSYLTKRKSDIIAISQ